MTPVALFKAAYEDLSNRLAATGATVAMANIPDVSAIPYLTSSEKVAEQIGLPLSVIGPVLGLGPGDFVTPDAFPLIAASLGNPALGPLPGSVVLDAAEVVVVRSTIDAYNEIIATQARTVGAALVDIHSLLTKIKKNGFQIGNQRLTADFLGGIFSLDGIHPTNTGYAILADTFIKELNRKFSTKIPSTPLEQIKSADPLVLPDVGRPASVLGHVSRDTVRRLHAVMHQGGSR
jgi:phospholipase/lecithinase/hemolysin